ncbi:hypothetical protein JZO73_13750 [Enterococcus plantarum]|uniref:transposon-transfer assisting family protein n=1 Tax=Enterococcus plantarum TaxID=1077675 RepID=UPI001A90B10E|nr:transposon-transfer assisting family protein [Enterococcus plantarum]MBO0468568.1 hypothetical protein [Enterococcus plantarum]
MTFNEEELKIIFQFARTDKVETLKALTTLLPALKHAETKDLVLNTIEKLEKMEAKECASFIKKNRKTFLEKRDASISQRLKAVEKDKAEKPYQRSKNQYKTR